jgi:hypothetical protein
MGPRRDFISATSNSQRIQRYEVKIEGKHLFLCICGRDLVGLMWKFQKPWACSSIGHLTSSLGIATMSEQSQRPLLVGDMRRMAIAIVAATSLLSFVKVIPESGTLFLISGTLLAWTQHGRTRYSYYLVQKNNKSDRMDACVRRYEVGCVIGSAATVISRTIAASCLIPAPSVQFPTARRSFSSTVQGLFLQGDDCAPPWAWTKVGSFHREWSFEVYP